MADEVRQGNDLHADKQPSLERQMMLSRDGNWLILKTVRTDIIHVNYIKKVLGGAGK